MTEGAIQLVPGRSDQDIVADLKQRMADAFKPFLALCDEAKRDGFDVQWQIGKDFSGRIVLTDLSLFKKF